MRKQTAISHTVGLLLGFAAGPSAPLTAATRRRDSQPRRVPARGESLNGNFLSDRTGRRGREFRSSSDSFPVFESPGGRVWMSGDEVLEMRPVDNA
eukprot:751232-Hanusia_phi.AAC.3